MGCLQLDLPEPHGLRLGASDPFLFLEGAVEFKWDGIRIVIGIIGIGVCGIRLLDEEKKERVHR